jgi:hypothetical protein
VFTADLTVDRLGGSGVHIVRTVAPDLVPFHVGFGMERLAHPRLARSSREGRLRTLLPHPFW